MKIVVHGAVQAHPAVITPSAAAFGAESALRTLFSIALEEAVAAIWACIIIIIMALQAGILTSGVALTAAVQTAVTYLAAFTLHTHVAVRAVCAFINAAILAHIAVFAVICRAFRAGAAFFTFGAFLIVDVALAAAGTRHIILKVTLQTFMR